MMNHPCKSYFHVTAIGLALFSSLLMSASTLDAATPHPGMLNGIEVFGAEGDGVTDDTEALRKAFKSKQQVYLPKGEYRVTAPLRAAAKTEILGSGGAWNARNQTVIRYDGPKGGQVLQVENAHFFQMRKVVIDGNGKADFGIYWNYSANECHLEDVAITGTLRHALYITRTWYATFTRVVARNNQGNGITLDRNEDPKWAKGPVNAVTFRNCRASHNGTDGAYDGEDRVDVGYGFASRGYNNMISLYGCSFEMNGGAGVYLSGPASFLLFSGCYIEQNSRALVKNEPKGNFLADPDRPSVGYVANIIDATTESSGVVFDTCYMHAHGGVWIRGEKGGRNPTVFRRVLHPSVIWAEHDGWTWENQWKPPVADEPGVIYRENDGKGQWRWKPETKE